MLAMQYHMLTMSEDRIFFKCSSESNITRRRSKTEGGRERERERERERDAERVRERGTKRQAET